MDKNNIVIVGAAALALSVSCGGSPAQEPQAGASGKPYGRAAYTEETETEMTSAREQHIDNKLYELTRRRRSVRRYAPGSVDDAVLREIMKVALTAPSSFGHRPVEYVIVRDRDMIRRIGACKLMGGSQVNGAGAVIAVMVRTADKREAEFWIEDGAIASAYTLLAAEQYGLGACWVHIRNRMGQRGTSDEEIRALLGVPEGYTVLNLVAVGAKGESKRAYTEDDLPLEKVHWDKF